jgi:hypothetical protein
MSEHTPGPWSIEPHGKGFVLYSGRDNQRHGMNLVYLTEPDWNWEANARLIAAAPDLLCACKRYLDAMERYGHPDKTDRLMRAAIEKAMGEV